MNFNIVTTPPFEKELKQLAKKYPSIKKEMSALAEKLLRHCWSPDQQADIINDLYFIPIKVYLTLRKFHTHAG